MDKRPDVCTATGNLVAQMPPGPERDEILGLVRIGLKFKAQHCGGRPSLLRRFVTDTVAQMPEPITFANLLSELDLAAGRRAAGDGRGEPIERVSRTWGLVTFHDARGPRQVTFGRLRNIFTAAKKASSRAPLKRESDSR